MNLGKVAHLWRGFPVLYIGVMFFGIPAVLLGLSAMFELGSVGFTVLASVLTIFLGCVLAYFIYWYRVHDGQAYCVSCFERREKRRAVMEDLPEDMEFLMTKVIALIDHTGLPDEDDEDSDEEHGVDISHVGGSRMQIVE